MKDFFKNKKVVVTGGSGFIGTHYLIELVNQGAKVVTHTHKSPLQYNHDDIFVHENLDLTKLEDCFKLVEGSDYVIHCAGQIAHENKKLYLFPTPPLILINLQTTKQKLEKL